MTKDGFNKMVYAALDALYVNPMTGAINEGYIQHINDKYGIAGYTSSYIKSHYGIEAIIGDDVVEEWALSHGKTLEKLLKKKHYDKKRV